MKKAKKYNTLDELDDPAAWQRFERAVDVVAKSPPQHRTKQNSADGVAKSRIKDSTAAKKKSGRRP